MVRAAGEKLIQSITMTALACTSRLKNPLGRGLACAIGLLASSSNNKVTLQTLQISGHGAGTME
jgi:hypothetical protein